MSTIDISQYSKADVLCALYNNSKPQGMGWIQAKDGNLTREEADELLKHGTYFDYLKGRVMKVDLSGDELDPYLYDRDNGENAATIAISFIGKRSEAL